MKIIPNFLIDCMVFVSNVEFFEDITRLLEGGQTVTFRTKGHSMVPFIVGGRDSVTLRRACGQIGVGDIVLQRVDADGRRQPEGYRGVPTERRGGRGDAHRAQRAHG